MLPVEYTDPTIYELIDLDELKRQTQSPASLIRLAFRARKKLGLQGVSQLRRAVGKVSRQLIYRVLTPAEIQELQCKS